MTDRIFNVDRENRLSEMTRSAFISEDLFQRILADHPAILGGISNQVPLLIRREQPVADSLESGGRWSLDHLYIDPTGVPILVEVKRASDTRSRREVVAQMLDYAANGTEYWKIGEIIKAFTTTCLQRQENPEEVMGKFLPEGRDTESFWQTVESNLQLGRIRMLFVADEIPRELRRIVEFLNEQMRPAEVLAVQVTNYQGTDGSRTLVPQLIGATERANSTKAAPQSSEALSSDEWLERLGKEYGANALQGALKVTDWMRAQGCELQPTVSQDAFSIQVRTDDGKLVYPFFIRRSSGARFETSLQYLKVRPAFESEESRQELHDRLKAIPGIELRTTNKLTGWPSFPVANLVNDEAWNGFTDYAQWVLERAKAGRPAV